MKTLKLDSILLFITTIPFIMTYRISWGETPYWLFGLIFIGILLYTMLDLLALKEKFYFALKSTLVWIIIAVIIGSSFLSAIIVRHQTAPTYMIHDIILQQEAAIRFLLHGKNPYAVNYFGTPLEQWHYSEKEINPALYHFVMEPFYLLFAIPFYLLSTRTIGYFDGRMPLVFLFLVMLVSVFRLIKDKEKRLEALILFAFNPAILPYTLEGRSDVFLFAFLFISWYFLYKKHFILSAIFMAFSFAIKQSVWPILPLYIAYLYFSKKDKKNLFKTLLVFFLVCAVIIGPFFVWDPKSFIDSTINYLSGSIPHSYPISGYGLSSLFVQMGFIKDPHGYFPFILIQLIISLPLLFILLKFLKQNPTMQRFIISYGILLFVFWYLSRYFNNSHLGYLTIVFLSAYFWPSKENHYE